MAIGDVRDIADASDKGRHQNQKLSTWRHGKLRAYLTYKAEAEGLTIILVDEQHTSKTCPNPICNHRHKPKGRVYRCPACGFQAHRDVVGAANILSRQLHGEVGKVRPPAATMYRHPFLRGSVAAWTRASQQWLWLATSKKLHGFSRRRVSHARRCHE
jgi:putative transposase